MTKNLTITSRPYYTLCDRDDGGKWAPGFGSYVKGEVTQEMADAIDSGAKRKNLCIIKTLDGQADIMGTVATLNEAL